MADSDRPLYKILSTRTLWFAAALIALVAAGSTTWLLLASNNKLEAIKTASTIVITVGGAAALLLAARRQRSTEIALNQKDRDLHHQERDAIERRITDLYTKAADQLGSDKAPVRLAGLYALERVAQNNPDLRQTIVNVLCAYLRMPYQPPDDPPPEDADESLLTVHRDRLQEREVRLTAQRLLADHLRPGDDPANPLPTFWTNINLDLTGATLIDFSFAGCTVHRATFTSANFTGDAHFTGSTFNGIARFVNTQFSGQAHFPETAFNRTAIFESSTFTHGARFGASRWKHHRGAKFNNIAIFAGATFGDVAYFDSVTFNGTVLFNHTSFLGYADFGSASFARGVPKEVRKYWSPPAQDA